MLGRASFGLYGAYFDIMLCVFESMIFVSYSLETEGLEYNEYIYSYRDPVRTTSNLGWSSYDRNFIRSFPLFLEHEEYTSRKVRHHQLESWPVGFQWLI
jgi:hypothetical protein